jgi:hypothetical protein
MLPCRAASIARASSVARQFESPSLGNCQIRFLIFIEFASFICSSMYVHCTAQAVNMHEAEFMKVQFR